jgi:hypothetical protein
LGRPRSLDVGAAKRVPVGAWARRGLSKAVRSASIWANARQSIKYFEKVLYLIQMWSYYRDMTKYRLATKEQIKAKVAAMERRAAERQAWMSNFGANLKSVTQDLAPEEADYLTEISAIRAAK